MWLWVRKKKQEISAKFTKRVGQAQVMVRAGLKPLLSTARTKHRDKTSSEVIAENCADILSRLPFSQVPKAGSGFWELTETSRRSVNNFFLFPKKIEGA